MNKKLLIAVSVLLLLSLVSNVSAADNFLAGIFEPFAGVDVAETYENYHVFIDAFLYFVLFISVAKVTLKDKFKGAGGNALSVVIGLILATSMTWWAASVDFTLKSLGVVAAGVLIALIAFFVFRLVRNQGGKLGNAVALAYVLAFLIIGGVMPQLVEGLKGNPKLNIIWSILNLIFIFALVSAVAGIIRWFKGDWSPTGSSSASGSAPGSRTSSRSVSDRYRDARERREKKWVNKADNYEKKLTAEMGDIAERMDRLVDVERKLNEKEELNSRDEIRLIDELENELKMTARIGTLIANIERNMKANSFAFSQYKEAIYQNIKNYKQYMEIVSRIFIKLRELLEKDKAYLDYEEKIGKRYNKLSKVVLEYDYAEKELNKTKASLIKRGLATTSVDTDLTNLKNMTKIGGKNLKDAWNLIKSLGKFAKPIKNDIKDVNRIIKAIEDTRKIDSIKATWVGMKRKIARIGKADVSRVALEVVRKLKVDVQKRINGYNLIKSELATITVDNRRLGEITEEVEKHYKTL